MRSKIIIVVLALCAFVPSLTKAQVDPHFSQYYAYPLWLNPALAGIVDGDYRINANYRTQWNNFGKPFSTAGVSADAPTGKNMGVGLNILNMSAGDAGYNYFNAMASFAYNGVKLGKNQTSQFSFGISAGLVNRRIDVDKLQLGSQYNPVIGFDPDRISGENFSNTSSTVFDVNAGILFFDGNPNHQINPFVGVSAAHLTQPSDPFVANNLEDKKLPIRYLAHGGARIKINDQFTVTPTGLYMRQGNAEEIVGGAYAQVTVSLECDVLIGANYRVNDCVIPFAGARYQNFTLGLSYDANTSDLRRLVNGSNSFEMSLSYIFRKKRIFQPEYFICPRL
ncbi:type IX secretion system PorP/SprF family membrane protein [Chitinophaga skermanii]|uniref:Type IX secretion system PorP/SprF family membrane protein n=1 Tax=Chitinophaga skermanii TaxID=331697 RepID=A0A327QAW8_9BACT|nr:type IX secretion system membrane protein PorP/SprF [Chitinophaga skermanii]RAJ01679.1 type IX secretion system PorP/SprF family membrane protein [Chitinophaga skermanii]